MFLSFGRVYDDNGQLLQSMQLKETFYPFNHTRQSNFSFLSAEDKNFFDHPGIDARGVTRAI